MEYPLSVVSLWHMTVYQETMFISDNIAILSLPVSFPHKWAFSIPCSHLLKPHNTVGTTVFTKVLWCIYWEGFGPLLAMKNNIPTPTVPLQRLLSVYPSRHILSDHFDKRQTKEGNGSRWWKGREGLIQKPWRLGEAKRKVRWELGDVEMANDTLRGTVEKMVDR